MAEYYGIISRVADLYNAFIGEKYSEVRRLCLAHPEDVLRNISIYNDTALHMAAHSKRTDLVLDLLKMLPTDADRQLSDIKNKDGNTILHEVATSDAMKEAAEELLKRNSELLTGCNELGEKPIFCAARYGQTEMFKFLAEKMELQKLSPKEGKAHLQRIDGTTVLHVSVAAECFGLALSIANKYVYLKKEKDRNSMTALQSLACNPSAFMMPNLKEGELMEDIMNSTQKRKSKHKKEWLVDFIVHDESAEENAGLGWIDVIRANKTSLKVIRGVIEGLINFDCFFFAAIKKFEERYTLEELVKLLVKEETSRHASSKDNSFEHTSQETEERWRSESDKETEIQECSSKLSQETQGQNYNSFEPSSQEMEETGLSESDKETEIEECSSKLSQEMQGQKYNSFENSSQETEELGLSDSDKETEIQECSSKLSQEMQGQKYSKESLTDNYKKNDESPLILATMSNIKEIVKAVLKYHPEALNHTNKEGMNILHVAIMYRHIDIFDMVVNHKVFSRRLLSTTDKKGNSVLHMVSQKRKSQASEKMQNPAVQLRDELHLFEKVKSASKMLVRDALNADNKTAEELFATTNQQLHQEAKEWLMRTAENCTILSVFIATVAFAAAYTVPGGPNQDTGYPMLRSRPFFLVFILADVISLTLALTSVGIFFSILTSSFPLKDFKTYLFKKLKQGVICLVVSVSMMALAFGATVALTMTENRGNVVWDVVAFLPVPIFFLSCSPLRSLILEPCRELLKIFVVSFASVLYVVILVLYFLCLASVTIVPFYIIGTVRLAAEKARDLICGCNKFQLMEIQSPDQPTAAMPSTQV